MILHLSLTGSVPSKKNSKQVSYKHGRPFVFSSKSYQQWHKVVSGELYKQILKLKCGTDIKFPLQRCESVRVYFVFGDKRRSDLSNKLESVMDLMVDNKVLSDDNWMCTGPVEMIPAFEIKKPRVEIFLSIDEAKCQIARTYEDINKPDILPF